MDLKYAFLLFFQSHVPEQIKKVLDAEFTDDNHLFTPLKKFPETFSDEERYIYLQCTDTILKSFHIIIHYQYTF